MDFDFSVAKNPLTTVPVALKTVYLVHADPTYDVHKSVSTAKELVLLRTTDGTGVVEIDGMDEIAVYKGTLLVFRHSAVRRYYCGTDKWDFWWFEFSANEGVNFPLERLLEVETAENEEAECKTCLELLKKDSAGSNRLASATLNLLMGKWMLDLETVENANPYRGAVEKVIYHARSNLERNIPVKEMAQMTGLCERRFRQVFCDIVGTGPKKYLEALRISTAEELLRSTPLSVNEISIRLGYSSQFHFSRAFKAVHGLTPAYYRKEHI